MTTTTPDPINDHWVAYIDELMWKLVDAAQLDLSLKGLYNTWTPADDAGLEYILDTQDPTTRNRYTYRLTITREDPRG